MLNSRNFMLTYHASRFTFHASRFTSHASRLTLQRLQHCYRLTNIGDLLVAGYFALYGQWSCIIEFPQLLDERSEVDLALPERIFLAQRARRFRIIPVLCMSANDPGPYQIEGFHWIAGAVHHHVCRVEI